jgi:hypothetical protein
LGNLIILDSNGKKGKWGAYPVVGLGYDHQAIKDELQKLNEILKTRFSEYAFGNKGEREQKPMPTVTINYVKRFMVTATGRKSQKLKRFWQVMES